MVANIPSLPVCPVPSYVVPVRRCYFPWLLSSPTYTTPKPVPVSHRVAYVPEVGGKGFILMASFGRPFDEPHLDVSIILFRVETRDPACPVAVQGDTPLANYTGTQVKAVPDECKAIIEAIFGCAFRFIGHLASGSATFTSVVNRPCVEELVHKALSQDHPEPKP